MEKYIKVLKQDLAKPFLSKKTILTNSFILPAKANLNSKLAYFPLPLRPSSLSLSHATLPPHTPFPLGSFTFTVLLFLAKN